MKESLPIDAVLPDLLQALREGPAVVLEAPPGAGKTTRVPPALLDVLPGEIVVLEPRRIAARAAARRVAEELGDPGLVGHQIRFERSGTQRTRLWYVTEGILARRLLSEPGLPGVSAVVIDEFHERHLPADLALALALRLLPRLKLVVMSATLDAAPLARHLGAPVIRSEGRRFPVAIDHLDKPDDRRLPQQVASAVRKLTAPGTEGDVLVFLPGAAEIRQAMEAIDELGRHRELALLPLHGDLSSEEQDRTLRPARGRKVIFSTNVAETSVTVPGVTAVIDSGLARIASHSPWSGLPMLTVSRISRASAEQRAGRAGRLAPGRALRLYTKHDFEARPDHHPPEIERLDLASLVLELRAAGIDPDALHWLDAPPPLSLHAASALLRQMHALDAHGQITDVGRACARLPVHPRLARLMVEASRRGHGRDGAALAAQLSERRDSRPTDVLSLLEERRDRRLETQLLRLLPEPPVGGDNREEALLFAVLSGFPDRVAKRRGDEVLLASGGSAELPLELRHLGELVVAVDAEERRTGARTRVVVRVASAVEAEWLLEDAREETEQVWSEERGRVEEVTRLRYGEIALEETRKPGHDAALLLKHAAGVPDPELVARLQARSEIAAAHSRDIPVIDDGRVSEAMRRLAQEASSLEELRSADVVPALLDARSRAALDRLAPEQVTLPGGRRVRVEYAKGQPPAIRSRLQDFFGMRRGPAICEGRVPLTLHLLAPNGRAQQVTQDLEGFWQRHYPAVRRELMRKYPRHQWPEDGATAAPPSVNRRS